MPPGAFRLTKEERELEASIDRGEWRSVGGAENRRYVSYARAFMQKTRRINIRLSPGDLVGIQQRAVEEGIPYQTLMASVIHKYVTGRLVDKRG